jgi:hypothetical protein
VEEIYKIADVSFSTADADLPNISFDDSGYLSLEFKDWREKIVRLKFTEVLGFKWDECDIHQGGRDDVTYEIINSLWLRCLKDHNVAEEDHRHYKLCFNASGNLDVLFKGLEVSVEE